MSLTGKQRNYLRGQAHHRNPVVTVGNAGLTEAVIAEITVALEAHELVKIKLPATDRASRKELVEKICQATAAECIQEIGRIAVIYRPAQKPKLQLPA